MRVVHVSVGGVPVLHRFGGAIQRRILETARVQAQRGDEVVIYSPGTVSGCLERDGVIIRTIACRSRGPLGWLELQWRAMAELRRGPVDIIHFHSQPEGAFLSRHLPAKKVLSYDYFLFRRGRKTPLFPLYRAMLKGFDRLLPVSRYCRDESRAYWQLPAEKQRVLYNGVNVEQFRPDPGARQAERSRLGIARPVVLYVGRVCHQKGTDLLIEACGRLNRGREGVQLVVAGPIRQFGQDGAEAREWTARIAAVGGLYLGAVAEEALGATYNLADVHVMPTRDLEMFGMAAVEAQACGKPVVASDHGGLRETVPLGCGGRFRVGDAGDLAEKIGALLDDPAARDRAALNARRNAEAYDWRLIVDELTGIYRSVA